MLYAAIISGIEWVVINTTLAIHRLPHSFIHYFLLAEFFFLFAMFLPMPIKSSAVIPISGRRCKKISTENEQCNAMEMLGVSTKVYRRSFRVRGNIDNASPERNEWVDLANGCHTQALNTQFHPTPTPHWDCTIFPAQTTHAYKHTDSALHWGTYTFTILIVPRNHDYIANFILHSPANLNAIKCRGYSVFFYFCFLFVI